jgi:hypothetical protein
MYMLMVFPVIRVFMNELRYLKFVVAKQITVFFGVLNLCRFSATVVGSSVISAYEAFESSSRFHGTGD